MVVVEILSCILTFIAGGGLVSVFLIKEKKKSAKLDNADKIIDMYKEITLEWKKLVCYNITCEMRNPKYKKECECDEHKKIEN